MQTGIPLLLSSSRVKKPHAHHRNSSTEAFSFETTQPFNGLFRASDESIVRHAGKQSSDWSARGNCGVWQAAESEFMGEKPLNPEHVIIRSEKSKMSNLFLDVNSYARRRQKALIRTCMILPSRVWRRWRDSMRATSEICQYVFIKSTFGAFLVQCVRGCWNTSSCSHTSAASDITRPHGGENRDTFGHFYEQARNGRKACKTAKTLGRQLARCWDI